MSQDLGAFIKNNSNFLKIQNGETVTMIYKAYSIVPDRFNPGKETVQYLLMDPVTNKVLPWSKSSTKVAAQMAKVAPGDLISITRFGEGTETTYRIKIVREPKPLGNVETPPIDAIEDDEAPF